MKFSIVTPLYNKEAFIADTIQSVLSQTYTDFEFIIINDSSTDRSLEIANSFKDERIRVFTKPNGGVSAARNYGISKAQGDIICFLDADDLWKPQYLEALSTSADSNPNISFFCGAFEIFEGDPCNIVEIKDLLHINSAVRFHADYFETSVMIFGSMALTSAVAVRRQLIKTYNLKFDERFCIGEDNDMWVKCCIHTKVLYNNVPMMLYRKAALGGLTHSHFKKSNTVDYTEWYKLGSQSALHHFASMALYTNAKKSFRFGYYKDSIKSLLEIRGLWLFERRIALVLLCIYKLICSKIIRIQT